MTWIKLISLALRLLANLTDVWREQRLLEAGQAEATADALRNANERVRRAMAARDAIGDTPSDPDDPYRRD